MFSISALRYLASLSCHPHPAPSDRLLFVSLALTAVAGAILFGNLGHSLVLHILFWFAFGATISGMGYANLSAGIIKSVKREKAAAASGLFVASLYIPAAFAGYTLGLLNESFGWSMAGAIQIAGCALLAAVLSLATATGRGRPATAA